MICGIDIGGTNTAIGLVDSRGDMLCETTIKTINYTDAALFVRDISTYIHDFCINSMHPLKGIGIGCPNGNFYTGSMLNAPNMPFKGDIRFTDLFRKYFKDIPIILTNDANAAAIGEMVYGKARGLNNFAMITIGTGLGSGFVANGELIYGYDGLAGELGHTIIIMNGRLCACGRQGCLEKYVSASGIIQTYFEICGKEEGNRPKCESFKELCAMAKQGDASALLTFDRTAEILGVALANTALITGPDHFFLFGGVMQAGDLLLTPTRAYFEKNILFSSVGNIKIEVSGLLNKNAAVLGAAALVRKIIIPE